VESVALADATMGGISLDRALAMTRVERKAVRETLKMIRDAQAKAAKDDEHR